MTTNHVSVIGGGPSGLFAVGALLDAHHDRHQPLQLTWLEADAELTGAGRLSRYGFVPANTKTRLFVAALTEFACFREAWERGGDHDALDRLKQEQQDDECHLALAAAALVQLTTNLVRLNPGTITPVAGARVSAIRQLPDGLWSLGIVGKQQHDQELRPQHSVVLATGAHPLPVTAQLHTQGHVPVLDLDDALHPDRLAQLLLDGSKESAPVAVVGTSHSAVLVMRNLYALQRHVVNVYRSPQFVYAEYVTATTIRHDNTGLKGVAAAFARSHLESPDAARLTRVPEAEGQHKIGECAAVVYAIGFERNTLPLIQLHGEHATGGQPQQRIDYDANGGILVDGTAAKGLFGFGIAFPKRVVDTGGQPEAAVGLWKFASHIRASDFASASQNIL